MAVGWARTAELKPASPLPGGVRTEANRKESFGTAGDEARTRRWCGQEHRGSFAGGGPNRKIPVTELSGGLVVSETE